MRCRAIRIVLASSIGNLRTRMSACALKWSCVAFETIRGSDVMDAVSELEDEE